jgi:dipeptidyl aminopeptidase/acylaminoacyl peptidase
MAFPVRPHFPVVVAISLAAWLPSPRYSHGQAAKPHAPNDAQKREEDLLRVFTGHEGAVHCAALSPDGKTLLSGGYDKTVRVWSAQTGKNLHIFRGLKGRVNSITFLPGGKPGSRAAAQSLLAVSGGDNHDDLIIWDVKNRAPVKRLKGYGHGVTSVSAVRSGQRLLIAAACLDSSIHVWDAASGARLGSVDVRLNSRAVAFSPNGKRIVAMSDDNSLRSYDVGTGNQINRFLGHAGEVQAVAFSPDGKQIASASEDGTLRLWNFDTAETIRTFEGHKGTVRSVSFSPDGKRLLSGGEDGMVLLWDVETGQILHRFEKQKKPVRGVAFSADGNRAISCSGDETIRLWGLPR